VPAETVRATGSGVPVGVEVAVVDVAGGAHTGMAGVGVTAPGHGDSWPKIVPLMGPNPFRRGPMLEKSFVGGAAPGEMSSGKIHSVTGCTY
jgi:hypothetical protein